MKSKLTLLAAALVILAVPAFAGEWHTGTNNLCTDCHTMHFSQSHNWDGTVPVSETPQPNGNWLSADGPNHFLLKAPVNQLCLACHDGQSFAPDVLGVNFNAPPANGRSAGALNMTVLGAPYDTYKGHTLDSTDAPPGYEDGVSIGLTSAPYDPAGGLECTSCHTQHGQAGVYRNLGPRSLGTGKLPNYVISNTTNDNNKDVWITIASPYTANTGVAATFNPFYATGNVFYNRRDRAVGAVNTSNGVDTQCAACHGEFHGNPGDAGVGGDLPAGAPLEGFIRHPTGGITIGAASAASYGGHSALSRYTGATTKVKVYTTDYTGFANATPGCITCHKAHGNQNPFGLVFLNRNASAVDEQGGYGTAVGTRAVDEPANGYQVGYRNLCGQCHSQGNS